MSRTFSDDYVRVCAGLAKSCRPTDGDIGLSRGRGTDAVLAEEVLDLRARVAELDDALARVRRAGAESMRERAAAECEARARYVQDADMTSAHELRTVADEIRALPIDDDAGEGAQGGSDA